jgi:hypothetical protein
MAAEAQAAAGHEPAWTRAAEGATNPRRDARIAVVQAAVAERANTPRVITERCEAEGGGTEGPRGP